MVPSTVTFRTKEAVFRRRAAVVSAAEVATCES